MGWQELGGGVGGTGGGVAGGTGAGVGDGALLTGVGSAGGAEEESTVDAVGGVSVGESTGVPKGEGDGERGACSHREARSQTKGPETHLTSQLPLWMGYEKNPQWLVGS